MAQKFSLAYKLPIFLAVTMACMEECPPPPWLLTCFIASVQDPLQPLIKHSEAEGENPVAHDPAELREASQEDQEQNKG